MLCSDLSRKAELDFDYSKIPAGSTDAELLEILETECFSRLRAELDQTEVLLAKFLETKCIPEILGRTRGLARRLTGDPTLVEGKGDLGEHVDPFVVEGSHALLNWRAWVQHVVGELVGTELPAFKFVTRSRQLNALAGLLAPQKKKVHRHRLLIGKIGLLDYSGISHALLAGIDDFMTQLQMGVVGRMFQGSGITRAHAECVNDIENMARTEKVERQNQLRLAASVVVENLGGDAERLRLAMTQNLYFEKILYTTLTEFLIEKIGKVVGSETEVSLFNAGWGEVFARNELAPSDNPTLRCLQANEAIRAVFAQCEWLQEVGVNPRPITKILVGHAVTDEAGNVEPVQENASIMVSNIFRRPLNPRSTGFVVDLQEIHEKGRNGQEAPTD